MEGMSVKFTSGMEGMGVKFTSGMGRRLLCHSSMFGPMTGSSGTHS